jgi:cell division protein FtsQ
VQSVGPRRAGDRRGSPTDGLVARGIAVSSHSPRSISLPSLKGIRRHPKRNPGPSGLGRNVGRLLAGLFLLSGVGYGVFVGGQYGRLCDGINQGIEALAVAAGFGVKQVIVQGQSHTTDAEITAALQAGPNTLMLGFDTDAAKARLEAVPWIRHAQVMRFLPSTLQVLVEEREPFAVWQSSGKTYVVDAEGTVLAPAVREAYAALPLVVGDGAEKNAAQLFDALEPYAELKRQLVAGVRVGNRRWTLKLATGAEIMLPDDNIADALATFAGVDHDRGLVGNNVAAVDLRLADRVTMRLRESGAPVATTPTAEPAPTEVPTAATKGAQPKGST